MEGPRQCSFEKEANPPSISRLSLRQFLTYAFTLRHRYTHKHTPIQIDSETLTDIPTYTHIHMYIHPARQPSTHSHTYIETRAQRDPITLTHTSTPFAKASPLDRFQFPESIVTRYSFRRRVFETYLFGNSEYMWCKGIWW